MSATTESDRRSTVAPQELVRLQSVSKTFAGVQALKGVELTVRSGEIQALVGHNGSGKSTLIKVMSGYHQPDPGSQVWVRGQEDTLESLTRGSSDGIRFVSFVHQDLGLVNELSAVDNLALHSSYRMSRFGTIDEREQGRRTRDLLARFDVRIDVNAPLFLAEPVDRTLVAIASAFDHWDSERGVLVLDEPTSALPEAATRKLLRVLRELRADGAGILFVSHDLDEVLGLADRVTVFRGGRNIASRPAAELDKRSLVHLMLGEDLAEAPDQRVGTRPDASAELTVEHLSGGWVEDVSFELRRGEVLGVVGQPGSGATSLPRLLFDQHRSLTGGTITLDGCPPVPATRYRPGASLRLVPPDRLRLGAIASMSVAENLSLSNLAAYAPGHLMRPGLEQDSVRAWMDELQIQASSLAVPIGTLSGGNQQRVLLARALAARPRILLLCEPTEGVDVGARDALFRFIATQVQNGLSVLVSSGDPGDLVSLCHRVLVLHRGRIVRTLAGAEITEQNIIRSIEGVDDDVDTRD